jgi:hypothetical protein
MSERIRGFKSHPVHYYHSGKIRYYFKYNWRVFFDDHPEELQKLTGGPAAVDSAVVSQLCEILFAADWL